MRHPLEFVPTPYRFRFFLTFLFLTLILFAIFRVLDEPLRTDAAPNGIVSFELARTPEKAFQIMVSWVPNSVEQPNIDRIKAYLYAAFGLGIDYLFMPTYALALAFGTLLITQKHRGWLQFLGMLAGYGALIAPLFDAGENFALLRVLLGMYQSSFPAIAAYCAIAKFALLIFGLAVCLIGWFLPKQ